MNVVSTGSSTIHSSSTNSSNNNNNNNAGLGSKRGRLLIRQQRIKKDGDQTGDLETPDGGIYQEYLLSVPSSGARMERHASEPSPASSGLISSSPSLSGASNLLTVPSHSSYLIKQHSHPLLPSQSSSPSTSYPLTRQLSHPIQTSAQQHQQHHHHHQTSQVVTSHAAQDIAASGQLLQLHQQKTMPVRSQTLPHYTVTDMDFSIGGPIGSGNELKAQSTQSNISSPTVVIIPDVSGDQSTIVQSQIQTQQTTFMQKSSSHHLQLPSIRVKSEELQRSISSPLVSVLCCA
jgi:hypothetical protein